jgi:hypothetical protein
MLTFKNTETSKQLKSCQISFPLTITQLGEKKKKQGMGKTLLLQKLV